MTTSGTDPLLVALSHFEGLREVPPEVLRASLPLWQILQLKPKKILWKQCRPADALAILHSGCLAAMVNGTVIDGPVVGHGGPDLHPPAPPLA